MCDVIKQHGESRHQLELKVLEVEPALTLLGNTLDEASHLLDTQNEVIRQIESKHSPVEELLRKADSLITNPSQRPIRPEVYAAMAESLGVAWRDVNAYLTRRRSILERNVNYHSEASKCYDCMSRLEATCTSALPTNPTSLQELTSRVRDLRRSMLESLMAALGQGKYLLDILKEVAREATAENIRISALAAISQVEHWLENLHDRRKMLEILWQSRKAKLNKYKIIIELREELSQLEYQVEELNRMIHMEEFTSGQCVSSAQKLYRQNEGYLIAAKEVQEKLIRFLKTLEDSADLKSKAYLLLQQCAELIHETETRAELWIKVMHFFSSSHAVIEKLKALQRDNAYNEEVKNWTPVLDEICGSVVLEGETLGIPIQNSEGIRVILQEIHQLRSSINSAWTRFQDSLIVRKLSSPAQPQAEPILARKYATLPSSMSRSQEYDREIRVEQFHRSLTPQHLTSPHAHQFQPIIQPHHELMSRSFDLGYSSFDQSSSPRQEWQRRVGPPLNRSSDPLNRSSDRLNGISDPLNRSSDRLNGISDPLNRSSDRLNGISDPLNRSSDRLNGISDPLNRSSDRLNRISDPLSRSRDFNHVDKTLSRSQEQLKIAEIRRALSPSVEDFENYIRNAYASPISPIDLEQAECRYTVETEVRRQLIVEHELRMGEQIEGSLEKESLARETQRRLEMIRENEILRKQEVEKIRNLEKLKQIELRKLEKLKQQRKYEEELLRIKDETEAEAKEKERIEIEARKEEERIALEIEAKEKSEAEEKARAKEIEARKLKLKQIGVEKQKAREEKIRSEMEYEREKELERKKEKERLLEAEKQLQREEEIKLRGDEEERERKRRETKLLAEIEEQQRVEELKQREREESKQRELEEERERKRREDLERLKDLEQELRRKHELQIKRESEERERIENERLQKEVEAKLERERREKEFEEQLIQEEIRRKKEIEAREKLLEQQRALDKALEEERTRKMKEMEEKLEEERKRKQREAEEQMEIERKIKEKEIQDRIEQERLRKEREAEEKIEQEKLRKQKEMQEKLEEERRQKEKELQDQLEKERIRKKREAEEELEREKRRKQKELEDKLEDERRQRMRETEELLERERRQKEREMQEELERERLRKQKETEEKLEQERIRKEKELQDRLEKERKQREAEEQKEIERKRREKEMEEQIEREREALKQKALEEERKHQEELERIKKEQELLEQERKRNEEMIQKEKEELRKQKEQELRKQIEELKEIGREKERQRLRDLEVIAQLEEERKCQKLKEEQGRALEEVRRQSQSPKSPTRTHTEHTTFVSKIPQPTSPLKKSPSPVQTSSGIPEDKLNQHSITEVNTGRLYTTKPLKRFLECYQHVLSWLTTDVEAFVNGHQDMGSGLALARQFYDLHVQYLQDLEERKEDISSIIQHIPSNIKPDARADMDRKLSNLNDKYSRLYSTIHTRLKLSKHYVSIHELSVNLSIEYDLLDLLLGKRQQQDQLIDDKLEKLNQMRSLPFMSREIKEKDNMETSFIFRSEDGELPYIGDSDTYLDIERTRTCIDTLLDHFDNRNLNIDSKYHSYQIQISKLQDTKIRLMQNMADSNKACFAKTF
ncbi:hypothetical protein M8J75_000453 [Diaphorina citri]|nr:hypothetical protein M8J75_000453 [Diaphorina citri]